MEWDITQYPQIQLLVASKEPFDRLWKTALQFNNSYDEWLNGKFLKAPSTQDDFYDDFYDDFLNFYLTH